MHWKYHTRASHPHLAATLDSMHDCMNLFNTCMIWWLTGSRLPMKKGFLEPKKCKINQEACKLNIS